MATNNTTNYKIWMYLGRRDKTEVRIIASTRGKQISRVTLLNVDSLGLPSLWQDEINQIIDDNKQLWEFWIHQADTFIDLRENLKTRGYTNIPSSSTPEYKRNLVSTYIINTNRLPKQKIMTAKKF